MQANLEKFSWFQAPEDIKNLLVLAAENWQNSSASEAYMNQALNKTSDNTDVLVAGYRYFYYKNNYELALQTAVRVIDKVKEAKKLTDDWQQLKPILINQKEDTQVRLYLHAYAASGLILAKLGEIEEAKEICSNIKEIDDKNEFIGASILFNILTRPLEEDE